jgi:predicted Zn-dependent protease
MRKLLLALALAVLAGCTSTPVIWNAEEIAATPYALMELRRHDPRDIAATVPVARVRGAVETVRRVGEVAGISPSLYLIDGAEPNAFATTHEGRHYVAVSVGLLDLLAEDLDAWAALMGHELAHLALGHVESTTQRGRASVAASQVLGAVLQASGIPFGGAVASVSVTAVERIYSRDEEREADRAGFDYAVRAGFDPGGAVRLWEKMAAASRGSIALPFLSSHPQDAERLEEMRRLSGLKRD